MTSLGGEAKTARSGTRKEEIENVMKADRNKSATAWQGRTKSKEERHEGGTEHRVCMCVCVCVCCERKREKERGRRGAMMQDRGEEKTKKRMTNEDR